MEQIRMTKNKSYIKDSDYDITAELTVAQFDLDLRNRTADFIDKKQCFAKWWFDNKNQFVRYNSYTRLAQLLKIHHATVIHLVRHRKATLNYKHNTKSIKEFLYDTE